VQHSLAQEQVSGLRNKVQWAVVVLASESLHTEISSLAVDKERMRSGHWLWSMLCVSLSALSLVVG